MYFDVENETEMELEEFSVALNLLHSTDDDSTDKLRQMLDDLIAKKYGPSKTLGVRMCREYSSSKTGAINTKNRKEQTKTQNIEDVGSSIDGSAVQTNSRTQSSPGTAVITRKIGQKLTNILVALDKTDIPTISIPDEGCSANDGALCKICNGARLGPLILLECQECQDVYHPLCHQPPVLDLDIYDPRLVWHCAKCLELSDAATTTNANILEDEKFRLYREYQEFSENQLNYNKKPAIVIGNDFNELHNYFRRNDDHRLDLHHQEDPISETTTTLHERLNPAAAGNGSLKNNQGLSFSSASTSSSAINLRKRVGSKLTMTRSANAAYK